MDASRPIFQKAAKFRLAPRRRQGGLSLIVLTTVMITGFAAFMVTNLSAIETRPEKREQLTMQRMEKIRQAVVQYVAANGHAPCGMNGATVQGATADGNPTGTVPTNTCGISARRGVVPWRILGLTRADSYDGWGRRISYRVHTGVTGGNVGLTAANTADMTYCDTTIAGAQSFVPLGGNSLCSQVVSTANHGQDTSFLAARIGFTVNVNGNLVPNVGLVLISHGKSGYAAYLASGVRMPLPATANIEETAHTATNTNTGTYYVKTTSDASVSPTAAAFFDDRIVYMTTRDLIYAAGRGPRDWY